MAATNRGWAPRLVDRSQTPPVSACHDLLPLIADVSPEVVADVLAESSTKLSEEGHHGEAISLLTEALRERHRRSTVTTAQLLNDRGIDWARLSHLPEAEADLTDSLRASRRSRDRVMQALVLENLSEVVRRLGKDGEAVTFGRKALELAQVTNHETQEADALGILGLALGAAPICHVTESQHRGSVQARRSRPGPGLLDASLRRCPSSRQ